jgi:hypothetical protein
MIYAYIRLSDLQYPIYEGMLRLEFPHIKEEQTGYDLPCPEGYAPVMDDQPIQVDPLLYYFSEILPKLIGGVWRRQWDYLEYSPEEKLRLAKEHFNNSDQKSLSDLKQAQLLAGSPHPAQADWQDFLTRLEAYMDEYPRVSPRPKLIHNVAMMNNSGNEPDVIG